MQIEMFNAMCLQLEIKNQKFSYKTNNQAPIEIVTAKVYFRNCTKHKQRHAKNEEKSFKF